jgi:tetratricopeptide (TPR) repeat protein
VTTNRGKAAERARELETELANCAPGERADLQVQAGELWHAAGDDERAAQLYAEAVAAGGESGATARVSHAQLLFDRDDETGARAMLAHLRTDPVEFSAPYAWAAYLLVDRGEIEQSLEWFDLAAQRLSEQELADYGQSDEEFAAETILDGRYHARRELGLPVDEFDELVPTDGVREFEELLELALELEQRAEQHPDQRGELLLEAAEAWQQVGDYERAGELCTEVMGFGGQDGAYARIGLASIWFDQERDDDAHAMLEALSAERPPYALVYQAGAELYAEMGDFDQALVWHDKAYAELIAQEQSGQLDDDDFVEDVQEILTARLAVRQELGLDPDDLDEAAGALLDGDVEYFDRPIAGEVRIPVWRRDEIPHARAAFPEVFDEVDDEAMSREYEAICRVVSASGAPSITLVPLTAAALAEFARRTGGTPGDENTRNACAEELAEQGNGISWPPPRNEPCWCGSDVKYKKCCGRPDLN